MILLLLASDKGFGFRALGCEAFFRFFQSLSVLISAGHEDTVADGVSNAFLRLLDKSSEKLSHRVEKLEKAGCSKIWVCYSTIAIGYRGLNNW